ncbi:MAG: SpoIIE family protein phosphatase, partial [candidate division KSB1 bacterium]|nr:SpoIIE family protein phosphatase [candidate division KSB1 bacterium]
KRLQEWVKRLGEPGAAEEMDIDTSSEIGAIAQAFSDITIQLKKSQAHLVEQERLQQEMHIAKQIQQTLLPSEFPELEGYEIAAYYAAAKEVGGDFYDFVEVDKDTVGVAVADVSGKGVPGAFVMTMIRTALRSEARGIKDAAEVLAKVNDFVVNDMKKGMFVTLLYVIIDSKRRRINFASAGHNPLILHRPSKNKTYYLNPRGFPIGIALPDKDLFRRSIESDTISLAEDDIILVYTDGVTEAMNPKRRLFGEERFLNVIRECGGKTAQEFIETLKKELKSFTEGNEQNDDITVVAIKEKLSADQVEFRRAARVYDMVKKGVGIKEACKEAGISVYAYYQKYKEKFEKEGIENFVFEELEDQVEAKHLSIEEKNKIYDIIRRNPDFGAKRIAEELNTERYGFTQIPASRIYEELVRMRLNTKELRAAFVQRGGKRRRIKPPGTPLLTVDGRVILNRDQFEEEEELEPIAEKEPPKKEVATAAEIIPAESLRFGEEEVPAKSIFDMDKSVLLTAPLEDVLDKRAVSSGSEEAVEKAEIAPSTKDIESKEPKQPLPQAVEAEEEIPFETPLQGSGSGSSKESTEEELFFGGESDLEMLAFEFVDQSEVSAVSSFEELTKEEEYSVATSEELSRRPNSEDEEFDWPTLEEYKAEHEHEKEAEAATQESLTSEESGASPPAENVASDQEAADDLFMLWAMEAEKKPTADLHDDRTYFWDEAGEEAGSFEEIFIDETEKAIFDLEQKFEFVESSEHDSITVVQQKKDDFGDEVDEGMMGVEEVIQLTGIPDDSSSSQSLLSVDATEEPLISQKDEEFDRLLEDAAFVTGTAKKLEPKEPEKQKKTTLEIAYQAALAAYKEKRYVEAVQILGTLPLRFPNDRKLQRLYGNASYRRGRLVDAVNAFPCTLITNPDSEQA